MKRLLIATDLSSRSELALARALRLTRQHGAELRVCHVVDDALPAHLVEAQKIAAGRVDTRPLVTHRFPLDRIEEAYELFANQRDGVLKVAITP